MSENNPPTVKKKAISYLRYSSKKQSQGESEKRQLEWTEKYCNENDFQLIDTYKDLGVSAHRGKHSKEGNLARLLDDCQSGKIPKGYALIIENFDRLSREEVPIALQRFLTLINDYKLEIHTLDDNRVYRHKELDINELVITIVIMGRAHSESVRRSVFITKKWESVRNADRAFSKPDSKPLGKHPTWLDWDAHNQVWKKKEDLVAVIEYIFKLSVDNNLGRSAIAQRLNAEKVKPFNPKKEKWTAGMIQALLINRALLGEFNPLKSKDKKAKTIPNYYPEVITPEHFRDCQRKSRLRNNILTGRPTTAPKEFSILTGVVHFCGSMMRKSQYGSGDKVTHTYVAVVGGKNRLVGKTEHIDHFLCSLISELDDAEVSATPKNLSHVTALKSAIEENKQKLSKLEKSKTNLTEAITLTDGSIASLVKRLQQNERDITLTEDEIANLERQLIEISTGSGVHDRDKVSKLKNKALEDKELQARQELQVTLKQITKSIDLAKNVKDLPKCSQEFVSLAVALQIDSPIKYWARIELFNDAVVLGAMAPNGKIARIRWEEESV